MNSLAWILPSLPRVWTLIMVLIIVIKTNRNCINNYKKSNFIGIFLLKLTSCRAKYLKNKQSYMIVCVLRVFFLKNEILVSYLTFLLGN